MTSFQRGMERGRIVRVPKKTAVGIGLLPKTNIIIAPPLLTLQLRCVGFSVSLSDPHSQVCIHFPDSLIEASPLTFCRKKNTSHNCELSIGFTIGLNITFTLS